MLRTMAMAVVSQTNVGVDEVSDAGLAIDEVAGLIFAVPGTSAVTATLSLESPVSLTMSSDGEAVFWPPQDFAGSLTETVLESITGEVEFVESADGPTIRLKV